jgi:hypothetical protein
LHRRITAQVVEPPRGTGFAWQRCWSLSLWRRLARARSRAVVGRYHLVATGASNPSQERSLCSAPYYEVREDASFVELVPGSYDLGADVSPAVARTFVGFGVRGRVIVEAAHCYSPAILCQREVDLDWEQTCRLVLEPRSCASPWFERRVLMRSFEDC